MSYTKSNLTKHVGEKDLAAVISVLSALERYVDLELDKLQAELTTPALRGLQFEQLAAVPARYKEGDLYYGIAGVFGGQAGLYIRDGNNWRKL